MVNLNVIIVSAFVSKNAPNAKRKGYLLSLLND